MTVPGEDFDLGIDDLFKDPEDQGSSDDTSKKPEDDANLNESVRKRINEVREQAAREIEKARQEALDTAAKEDGYENYEAKKKALEKQEIEKAGFKDTDFEAMFNKMYERRAADDPRLKRLEYFEQKEREANMKAWLGEINSKTGQNFVSPDQLPPDVIELHSKGVPLDKAYIALHGVDIIQKSADKLANGTTTHLQSGSTNSQQRVRSVTKEEAATYEAILSMGGFEVSQDDLAKLTLEIDKGDK